VEIGELERQLEELTMASTSKYSLSGVQEEEEVKEERKKAIIM
jgi:hypothetical protein